MRTKTNKYTYKNLNVEGENQIVINNIIHKVKSTIFKLFLENAETIWLASIYSLDYSDCCDTNENIY